MSDSKALIDETSVNSNSIRSARDLRLRFLNDRHRPGFHFVVPEDIARPADPNGAIFWNGRYHLGYIYQDQGIHKWGHVSSIDLLHWRHHLPWLEPTSDSPEVGIYSGNCFINKSGEATMLYHGVEVGNCIATSSDPYLDIWKKIPGNPVVPAAEGERGSTPGANPFASWDPCGWLYRGTYYAIFGGKHPAILKSSNLNNWEHIGSLFSVIPDGVDPEEDVSCPDFFPLGDKWVLVCISHRLGCRYYVGDWDGGQFSAKRHEQMSWVDNYYFAPESCTAPDGRRIMWTWLRDAKAAPGRPGSKLSSEQISWYGTFSIPRELWLRDDLSLGMRPVTELSKLRYNGRKFPEQIVQNDFLVSLPGTEQSMVDIELRIDPLAACCCGVEVLCSADSSESTVVGYDAEKEQVFIDTRGTNIDIGTQAREAGTLLLGNGETLRLRIVVDKQVVEVFANDRQAVARLVYPKFSKAGPIKLFATGGAARFHEIKTWEMMPSNPY